ncbi:glyceraldehyde 3-phosphate dehydrogenase [Muriicola jejuensis]|uniref:Type I glyceraldehyde-3-phosphate dehydrogenase n=1 Tax=Muriicola jejuensis TaxID=504488 RepID=A0A6P0UDB4_9FLAO|nr:type I glyceraldehyde-3-phosphate dehydrogenase [Muriicola jejuensis]NER09263.1 type I glyceraldehyde-3-phosphate dehydrogenase [Muriicola jejuensis]SMP09907.1 glyceraldehyde 3-phosphate dehydrogenase [Muriicola jejuensis]
MKTIRVGINGFGRIGRTFLRLLQDHPQIRVTAINDLSDPVTLGHLLKYDSIHGPFKGTVEASDHFLKVDGKEIAMTRKERPEDIPWAESGVDLVLEATGKFKTRKALAGHLENGVRKVILSVPPDDQEIRMIVYGVNHHLITEKDDIISNASCTTNNAAPMIKVLNDHWGVEQAYITTVHSYTSDQSLHDKPHKDLRRARAAGQSIIPTTTGAAKALTRIFPELAHAIGGCGIRVPVPNGSLTDITLNVKKDTSIQEINDTFEKVAENELKNVLFYTKDPIVSIDINNSCYSCTFDSMMTSVLGKMVKVIGWYDNETGYSSRIIDVIELMERKGYI